MTNTKLTDLPPELLDQIVTYLPQASSLTRLALTAKSLKTYVDGHAWEPFVRARFPSLCPVGLESYSDAARSLTALSRAWDRRAFLARYIEPNVNITTFPNERQVERWKRPRGQTIGFTPQIDCYEEIGSSWQDRQEVVGFTAGAEVCIRNWKTRKDGNNQVRWSVHRPEKASEGRDDISGLHLIRPPGNGPASGGQQLIVGTASGDLHLVTLGRVQSGAPQKTRFLTHGFPIRSTSLLQGSNHPTLLAAAIGDSKVSLFDVASNMDEIETTSSIDIRSTMSGQRGYRAWSTNFLTTKRLAVGLGPSEESIHIYELEPSGLHSQPLRKFGLTNLSASTIKKSMSSVYPIKPVPPPSTSASGRSDGEVFLSGAYDGVIRLHDMRSSRDVEQRYSDPNDDSAIYSILPRGQETLVAGTSRHSLLKVFDMRLGAKAYSYLNTAAPDGKGERDAETKDWNLFLKPQNAIYPGRGGGNNWARRSAESSVYSLASPSPHSPKLYCGIENAIVELTFTSLLDKHTEPLLERTAPSGRGPEQDQDLIKGFQAKESLELAMYNQTVDMKLMTQRSPRDIVMLNQRDQRMRHGESWSVDPLFTIPGLDARWKIGSD